MGVGDRVADLSCRPSATGRLPAHLGCGGVAGPRGTVPALFVRGPRGAVPLCLASCRPGGCCLGSCPPSLFIRAGRPAIWPGPLCRLRRTTPPRQLWSLPGWAYAPPAPVRRCWRCYVICGRPRYRAAAHVAKRRGHPLVWHVRPSGVPDRTQATVAVTVRSSGTCRGSSRDQGCGATGPL